ncbi:response regulator transcription factor [Lentzea sp. BCCO 10_0061]|uniref:Response regulator transcription factor n=1 Tax=Lentzea sokolovensis TaxID=3095429 RepID=A0ABU4VEZ1_9PSEU|nr:response regulator transcription factor [Lentzea sp. BCCO 10_0061]MDX8149450.1 response regulator transcription factor [Lentzea sp. BCCO 10_0061]
MPDVLLIDLGMPGTDGLTAARQLAGTARVLVLTTYDSNDVVSAIEAGATARLIKDAPRDEFVRAVRAATAGRGDARSAVAALQMRWGALEVPRFAAGVRRTARRPEDSSSSETTAKPHPLAVYAELEVSDQAAAVTEGVPPRPDRAARVAAIVT